MKPSQKAARDVHFLPSLLFGPLFFGLPLVVASVRPLPVVADDTLSSPKRSSIVHAQVTLGDSAIHFESADFSAIPENLQMDILQVGDLNGDGRSDVLGESKSDHSLWVGTQISPMGGDRGTLEFKPWSGFSRMGRTIRLGDLNGDGCADIVAISEGVSLTQGRMLTSAISNCRDSFSPTKIDRALPPGDLLPAPLFSLNAEGSPALPLLESLSRETRLRLLPLSQGPNQAQIGDESSAQSIKLIQEVHPIGFGHFLPDSFGVPLLFLETPSLTSTVFRLATTKGKYSSDFVWAQLPWRSQEFPRPIVADFSGDGLDDFLVQAPNSLVGWWLAESNGEMAIEHPVIGLDSPTSLEAGQFVGDFDGDGLADLLRPLGSGKGVFISFARFGSPVENVEISLDSVSQGKSNSSGALDLPAVLPGRHEITASLGVSSDKNARRVSRVIQVGAGPMQRINLRIPPPETDSRSVGHAISLGSDKPGPYICLGYTSRQEFQKWGVIGNECPEGYAYLSAERQRISAKEPGPIIGSCCRLPAPDILTEERVEREKSCPEGFVAIGAKNSHGGAGWKKPQLVCARVNGTRYRLGPKVPGVFWGVSLALPNVAPTLLREQIPLAIRYGVQRYDYRTWDNHGCLGNPWGALLVDLAEDNCSESFYRELQYTGQYPGDPGPGTPVKMFPDCSELENIFDPTSGCRPKR